MSFAVIDNFNSGKSARKDDHYFKKQETEIHFLPDKIVDAVDSCTTVIIYCPEEIRDATADRFKQIFDECYDKAMTMAEEDFNEKDWDTAEEEDFEDFTFCEERDCDPPLSGITKTADGLIVRFGRLDLHEALGGHHMFMTADSALEDTLRLLCEEFPSISYEGHVAELRNDARCGEVIQYVFSSDKTHPDYPYQSTGAALASVLRNDDFWRYLSDYVYDEADYIEILQFFKLYPRSLPSDALNRLLTSSLECEEKEKCVMKEFRLLLLEYKNKYFPDADPLDELKLES
jgi:hypothetical protein